MGSSPKPIAEGTLGSTPLGHVLVSIERRKLSGTLAVWPDRRSSGQDRLLFDSGSVIAARLLEPAPSLELGLLPLFQRVEGPYAFYSEDLLGDTDGVLRGRVSTGALIAASLRGPARTDVIDRVLATHGGKILRLVPRTELDSLGLLPHERAIVELVQAEPATLERITSISGDHETARRIVYLLTVTKRLESDAGVSNASSLRAPPPRQAQERFTSVPDAPPSRPAPRPTASSQAPARRSNPTLTASKPAPPPPPPGLEDDHRDRWLAITDFAEAADSYNYFQLLGVEESAGIEEINAGYAQQAKRLHPDRLPQELSALAPSCQELFHRLTEAKNTLSDTDSRLAHIRAIRSGGGTPAHDRKLAAIVGAAMEFQKVDVLVRQRKQDEALEVLEHVLSVDPDEPDYLARKAWILSQIHLDKTGPRVAEILALVEKALEKNPKHEQAHFTMATLLKRQGQASRALSHFEAVLQANPKNIDAARELRIAEMRKHSVNPSPRAGNGEPGLLKKLFGKKGE